MATVEEKVKLRRLKLRDKAKGKATRAKPPARGTESGLGGVGGASLAFRSGGVAGRKRKSTAAGAAEAERAEKVRREVQWAHVRAAVCARVKWSGSGSGVYENSELLDSPGG